MVFDFKPVAPFRLDLTVWTLRRMPVNEMDQWDGQTYRRVIVVGQTLAAVEVRQLGPPQRPVLRVTVGGRSSEKMRSSVKALLTRVLGLDVDLGPFYEMAKRDPRLYALTQPFVGFRPPRLASVFEALLNGIACQQLSLNVGIQLLNRLCRAYGREQNKQYAFPRPSELALSTPAQLKRLGFSRAKAKVILGISRSSLSGKLDLDALAQVDNATALQQLQDLRGIGRWTAEYVLLRGLGRLDVFPGDDVGGQNKLQRWLRLRKRPDFIRVNRIVRRWPGYQGLIYFHLLLDELSRRRLIDSPSADKPG